MIRMGSCTLQSTYILTGLCGWYTKALSQASIQHGECFSPRSKYVTHQHHRDKVEPLISGVSGNIHESFLSWYEAESRCAYTLAYALGAVCQIGHNQLPVSAAPPPVVFLRLLDTVNDDFLNTEWHVVYKGK